MIIGNEGGQILRRNQLVMSPCRQVLGEVLPGLKPFGGVVDGVTGAGLGSEVVGPSEGIDDGSDDG